MAEKGTTTRNKPKVVDARGTAPQQRVATQQANSGKAKGMRFAAVLLWLAGIACEVLGVLMFAKDFGPKIGTLMTRLIVVIVADLIFIIIGSLLWKKANHISPASERNKMKFWLWNNMGLIACVLAFVPFIILLLANKNVDGKTKKVASIVAVAALVIGGISSYDWNPVSQESKRAEEDAAIAGFEEIYGADTLVCWPKSGNKYHLFDDCQSFTNTSEVEQGYISDSVAAGHIWICSFCERNYETAYGIDGDSLKEKKAEE